MAENLRDLVAKFGSGDLSREQLGDVIERAVRAQPGDPRLIPNKMRPTGVVLRILVVNEKEGNTAEGVVKPGALALSQRLEGGTWRQVVTYGEGAISIDGRRRNLRVGQTVEIKAGQRFVLINDGKKPWAFKVLAPPWGTTTFSYTFERRTLAGDEIWFGLRNTPTAPSIGTAFRILPAAAKPAGRLTATEAATADATDCVALVNSGESVLLGATAAATSGDQITVLSGTAEVGFPSLTEGLRKAAAPPMKLAAGQGTAARPGQPYTLTNRSRKPSVILMRPDPPRVWTPESSLFAVGDDFSTGEQVWFELLLPF